MHHKKLFGLLGAIVAIATISAVVTFENTDAKEPSLSRMYVSAGMDSFFEIKRGQTMTIPINLTNSNTEKASYADLFVTSHGYEPFKDSPMSVFEDNGISVRLSKQSTTIPASTADTFHMDHASVTVSVPKDTEPGLYEYTLIIQAENGSTQFRKYFYITVV